MELIQRGQMIPAELERLVLKSIADGKIPFLVTATAGTTVFGAFDPINPIADICEKHHLWLHIDVRYTIWFPSIIDMMMIIDLRS